MASDPHPSPPLYPYIKGSQMQGKEIMVFYTISAIFKHYVESSKSVQNKLVMVFCLI